MESVRSSAQSSRRQVAWACARPRSSGCSMAFDIRCRLGNLSCSQYQSTVAQYDRCRFARVRKALSCAVTNCEAYMFGLHFPHRTVAACTNRICCRICCGYHFPASMQAVPVSHARAAWAPLHHVCRSICRQTACLQSPSVIARVGYGCLFKGCTWEWTNDHRQGQEDCRTDNINDCLQAGLILRYQYRLPQYDASAA